MKKRAWFPLVAFALVAGMPAGAQNLLQNPGFNEDLAGWSLIPGNGSIAWDGLDSNGSASSGSARVVTPSAEGETSSSIQQCVAVTGGSDYSFSAKVFRPQGELVTVFGTVIWQEGAGCSSFLADDTPISLFPPGSGEWEEVSGTVTAPGDAESALVRLRARREDTGAKVAHFDDVVFAPDAGCVDEENAVCLNDGRFRVTVDWRTNAGGTGAGHAVRLTADTGYFWFFKEANVELVIKVHDACSSPFQSYWVFAAGLTDVEVEIRVEDTEAEVEETYFNPLGTPFPPLQDTAAFATCP